MKKITLILVILLFSISWSATLNKIYHGNYGEIDRVVVVVSTDTDYSITPRPKKLKITLRNTTKGMEPADKVFTDNPVLEAWDFQADGDDLLLSIYTDKQYVTHKPLYYKENGQYKLVIDIFNSVNPQTYDEYMSYALYNERIKHNQVLAQKYRQKGEEVKKNSSPKSKPKQEEPEKDSLAVKPQASTAHADSLPKTEVKTKSDSPDEIITVSQDTVEVDSIVSQQDILVEEEPVEPESIFAQKLAAEKSKISQQNQQIKSAAKNKPSLFTKIIIVVIQLLLVFFIIKIIIKLIKENLGKKHKIKHISRIKEINYRSEAGFGEDEFKKEVIEKLRNKGWQISEIAQELELTEEEVASYMQDKPEP